MGLSAWLALVACILVGGAATLAWAHRVGVVRPAAAGLAAQGVITIGLYAAIGLWAPDAIVYDDLGQEFAASWKGGPDPSEVTDGKEAFPVMLGAVYFVVGTAPGIGLVLNWASHGLLIPALAALAKRADLPSGPTAWVVALFPPALFWSALLLRESITWLLMAVFLYALVGLARGITVRDLAIMVAALVALMWFRGTAAVILAGVSMVVLVLTAKLRTLLPRCGVAMLAMLVLSPRLASLLFGYTTVDDIEAKRSDLSNADTSFGGEAGGDVEGTVATSFLDSAIRVALGPYPWEWPSLGAPFALDAALWLAILGLAVLGWWRASNRLRLLLVVLPALALAGALMITSANYGTMQRLRVQTSVLLTPMAAAGFTFLAAWWRSRLDRKAG
ncbi:hypothetical protein [Nocardioides astragali]|uniref:Glycosyltransferase RgtA/B/C/D-like domain-containing protein n=1 Tax=Nocardioides astragali TaxID=1776736 RepID=A0ABW2N524_9ACTN|nr:hypothetical protein [Nocardioides astragali]